ncbi:MAG: FtsX-like permease family protein, partial [Planctomycetota bacterium]|nr:FtsX-like permease family protein [Planctomycetota bacterium]
MNRLTLILRGLAFHWRAHLAAGLASAVGTAVLVGALLVGDSVRYSLRAMAVERLGLVNNAILGGDRFFRADLAQRMNDDEMRGTGTTRPPHFEAMIVVPGVCIHDTSGALAGQVRILGVLPDFSMVGAHWPREALNPGDVFLNEQLATALNAKAGDVVRLRVGKPNLLSLEAPTGPKEAKSAVLRATVRAVLPDRGLGRFSFDANQIAPPNAYVPLAELQEKLEQKGRANVLLSMHAMPGTNEVPRTLRECWSLDDAQLRLRADEKLGFIELTTPRVFLDAAVSDALLNHKPETTNQKPTAVLTYFVNAIRANGKETPYSMVTAGEAPLVPADLKEGEILLNDWTADDLGTKPGDKVELEYFTVGLARKLETHKNTFTVKALVPLDGRYADRSLMPEFPGIAEVDSTQDWDSSIPIDMRKIRPKDEDYWKKCRGTPKAFIALNAGVRLWQNRFGTYTALRVQFSGDPGKAKAALDEHIRRVVDPAAVGLQFTPVRALALQASAQAQDFGQLFLGFSFFLIVAALLLMALIFRFNVEARASETGLLLALGFRPRAVRGLLWAEGALMACLGGLLGVGGGIFYAQWLLHALATRWQAAVGTAALEY